METKIITELEKISTEELIESVKNLNERIGDGVDYVYDEIINIIEYRLSEEDFIKLMDELYI